MIPRDFQNVWRHLLLGLIREHAAEQIRPFMRFGLAS